jgi:DNA gyrase subunit A
LIDASDRNGPVVGVAMVAATDQLMLITDGGQTLRTSVAEIRETGRSAQGVSIMRVVEGERVVAIETFAEEEDAGTGSSMAPPDDGGSDDEPTVSMAPPTGLTEPPSTSEPPSEGDPPDEA